MSMPMPVIMPMPAVTMPSVSMFVVVPITMSTVAITVPIAMLLAVVITMLTVPMLVAMPMLLAVSFSSLFTVSMTNLSVVPMSTTVTMSIFFLALLLLLLLLFFLFCSVHAMMVEEVLEWHIPILSLYYMCLAVEGFNRRFETLLAHRWAAVINYWE